MCRGAVSTRKILLLKSNQHELVQDDTVKSLATDETSSVSSFSLCEEQECAIKKKSCLKVKTQAESLAITPTRSPSSSNQAKSVYFSTLEIHVFALQLGDNPSTSSAGVPLAIGAHAFSKTLAVDDHEESRKDSIRRRGDLYVPPITRTEWLLQEGFTKGEMMQAESAARRVKLERLASRKDSIEAEEEKEEKQKKKVQSKLKKWLLQKPSGEELYIKWKETDGQAEALISTPPLTTTSYTNFYEEEEICC